MRLDHSSFSEQALPLAAAIAERILARLDLMEAHRLYALDDPTVGWARYEPDRDADCKEQERLYLGANGRRGLKRAVLGSVADQVLRGMTVPMLLQRARPQ